MKNIIISLMLTFSITTITLGQNSSDKVSLKAESIYIILLDDEWNEVSRKPMGKDVYFTYDSFFKSYHLIWTGEQKNEMMSLYFVGTTEIGKDKMKDHAGNYYYLDNLIETDKQLVLYSEKKALEYWVVTLIDGITYD